jgi:hypothetical protein
MYLQKQPAGLYQKGFQFGNLQLVLRRNRSCFIRILGPQPKLAKAPATAARRLKGCIVPPETLRRWNRHRGFSLGRPV